MAPISSEHSARIKAVATVFGLPILLVGLMSVSVSNGWFSWPDLWCLLIFYALTMFGLTAGYHRLFTHRSYEPTRSLKIALGILGAMAAQGPILFWASVHRTHHRHSDHPGDPHSPRESGSRQGFMHAHVGWMLATKGRVELRTVRDLASDPDVRFLDRHYSKWVILGLVLPALAGWTYWSHPIGIFQGFLYGGLLRMVLVQHAVWGVNSICHLYGYRSKETGDEREFLRKSGHPLVRRIGARS